LREDGVGIADDPGNIKIMACSVFRGSIFVFLGNQLGPYSDMPDLL